MRWPFRCGEALIRPALRATFSREREKGEPIGFSKNEKHRLTPAAPFPNLSEREDVMTYTTLNAAAYLHHIQLQSSNPERLAKFYGDAMQMQVERAGDVFICRGPQRRLIVSKGE